MSAALSPIREPAVAGQFYPADPEVLAETVDDLLDQPGEVESEDTILGIVAPHAGYAYSGAVAASAYRLVRDRDYRAAIVIAPSHQESFRGSSVLPRGGYRTPLGTVPVDEPLAREILARDAHARDSEAGHRVAGASSFGLGRLRGEHAIEVQLPFLQRCLPDVPIVPVVIGGHGFAACESLGRAIAEASAEKRVLVIASSDLYHGHSYDECLRTDAFTLERIQAFDPEAFAESVERQACQACGSGPICAAMVASRTMGAERALVVRACNSGDVSGLREGYVVGYGAVAFVGNPIEKRAANPPERLSEGERRILLDTARSAIRGALRSEPLPALPSLPPRLQAPRGAFVTLKRRGELRGCIGQILPVQSLAETVREMAIAAALRDPRFDPVTASELPDLEVEISVLTPTRRIRDPREIRVGRDGLLIRSPQGQGLLLPQVAAERGWGAEEFLVQTCRKAGLARDAWKRPETEINVFSAEVFGSPVSRNLET